MLSQQKAEDSRGGRHPAGRAVHAGGSAEAQVPNLQHYQPQWWALQAEVLALAVAALRSRSANWTSRQLRAMWLFLWISSAEPCRLVLDTS